MIKFNKNSNIFDYDILEVVECIKKENRTGKRAFIFDSNFSAVHFFNYFIESLEQEEEKKYECELIRSYLLSRIKGSPASFNDAVDEAFSLLELDDNIKQIFAQTTPQVICAFLYNNLAKLIFDEFFFFYDKSPTLSNIVKELKIDNVEQILYEITLAVSYKIKRSLKDILILPETIEITTQDLENFVKCPQDLKECIDWLINAVETKSTKFKMLPLEENSSTDVLTCGLFGEVNHILYFGWYLHYDKSPLRKWFKKERKITDPYYISYYIIRNFVNFLLLKKSIENGI